MRQATARKQTTKQRDSPKELMVESLEQAKAKYRFTKEDRRYIKKRRQELESEGKKERAIARIIAKEKNWNFNSVNGLITRMIDKGELQRNMNSPKKFSEKDGLFIVNRRRELETEGKNDTEIARIIAKEKKWRLESVDYKIRQLVQAGNLNKNANIQDSYLKEATESIIKRRKELEAQGKNDSQIAKILSKAFGRSRGSIAIKIIQLVNEGKLQNNKNKQKKFTEEQKQQIIKRRKELESEGKKDSDIAKIIAQDNQWSISSTTHQIRHLIENGQLEKNANFTERYSNEDREYIIRRREELEAQGKNDRQIAGIVAKEKQWIMKSIEGRISHLIKKGKLKGNRNKQHARKFTAEDEDYIIKRRQELEKEGKRDDRIANEISKEKKWNSGSIKIKIRQFIGEGKLQKNKNFIKRFSANEDLYIIRRRNKLQIEGKNDAQIARIIEKEKGWASSAVIGRIGRLIIAKKLQKNTNYFSRGVSQNEHFIIKRRKELERKGNKDSVIAKKIAREKDLDERSVANKIRQLIQRGELNININSRSKTKFTSIEDEYIIQKRKELEALGMNDSQIAGIISEEIGFSIKSVNGIISRLVKTGKLESNVNSKMKRRFTPEEEKYIIYRRQVLEAEGKNDRRIGIIIAKERGWSEESTIGKIWKFVRVGKLKENKNKHKHNSKQTREAILTGLKDAADAMEQFGDVG